MTGRLPHLLARWSHRASDRVVAVSAAVRRSLIDEMGVDPSKIEVIANRVDTQKFNPAGGDTLRRALDASNDQILVGFVGRLSHKKGIDFLVRASRLAIDQGANLGLVIVGEGDRLNDLENLVDSLDLRDRVYFLGFRADVEVIYPGIDIFVLPSLEEGSPNALLEAMACGCAPVASSVGGVPEIIDHGVSGFLIQPGSVSAIADRLSALARDSDLRSRLQIGARRRIEDDFDFVSTAAEHQELYSLLLR